MSLTSKNTHPHHKLSQHTVYEAFRFIIVGVIATAIHYSIYWLLQQFINAGIAYTIGYAISFAANFLLTSLFTFKTKATVKRGLGFALAHLCNYLLQMLLLHITLGAGVSRELAPIPVYCISIPVNFLMVRFVFKKLDR